MKKKAKAYHHGNLAESLLEAVDEIAGRFGLEAVTLRACAKLVGVSPSSAFRHYSDKRALLTAFAASAMTRLANKLVSAGQQANLRGEDAFVQVGLAYVEFALDQTALFRAMWREETIYVGDESYVEASRVLSSCLQSGFANTIEDKNPETLSAEELLAWSSVHGVASLLIDGPLHRDSTRAEKLEAAEEMIRTVRPVYFRTSIEGRDD